MARLLRMQCYRFDPYRLDPAGGPYAEGLFHFRLDEHGRAERSGPKFGGHVDMQTYRVSFGGYGDEVMFLLLDGFVGHNPQRMRKERWFVYV